MKGLSQHDVQVGTMCKEEVEKITRLWWTSDGDQRNKILRWNL